MKSKQYIVLKQGNVYKRVVWDDLIFIKVEDYVLTCVLKHGEMFSLCRSMEEFKKMLPSRFVQINRSKIINLDKVIRLDRKTRAVTLTDSSKHRVAARRIKDVLNAL